MSREDTGLRCAVYGEPVFVGDKFRCKEHEGECCQHYIEVVIKKDDISQCGYGLYRVDNGEYVRNGAVTGDRV